MMNVRKYQAIIVDVINSMEDFYLDIFLKMHSQNMSFELFLRQSRLSVGEMMERGGH